MKKIILLGFLVISSFVLAYEKIEFPTHKMYCTNFNYDNARTYVNKDDGTPYLSVRAQQCFVNGGELKSGPYLLYIDYSNPAFYAKALKNKSKYFFFKEKSNISITFEDDKSIIELRLGNGGGQFSDNFEYYGD